MNPLPPLLPPRQADGWFEEALSLRDSDPEQAIDLMSKALEARNRAHGETALDCAHAYMYYGQMLFEQAQASSDVLGERVSRAAKKRDGGGSEDGSEDAGSESAGEDEGEDVGGEEAAAAAGDAGASGSNGAAADGAEEEEEGDPDDMQVAFEMLDLARVIFERHGGAEEYPSETADIYLYLGDHAAEREQFEDAVGEYGKAAAALARMEPVGGGGGGGARLLRCLLNLGVFCCCSQVASQCITKLPPPPPHQEPRRRVAEVLFKKALALQFGDDLEAALAAITAARATLTAHADALKAKAAAGAAEAAGKAAGAGAAAQAQAGEVAQAAAAGADALSMALASYAAPAPAAPLDDADEARRAAQQQQLDAAAAAARARREAEDVRLVLEDMAEKADELRSLIAERGAMKDALAGALRVLGGEAAAAAPAAAAAEGAPAAAPAAGAAQKPAEVVEYSLPGASTSGAPVRDLGVVGRGQRATPVATAAAATATAAPKPDAAGKRTLADLMGSGGETTVGFGASTKSNAQPAAKTDAAAAPAAQATKRVRQEPVPAAAAAPEAAAQGGGGASDENSKE
jgi:hypothetical protein